MVHEKHNPSTEDELERRGLLRRILERARSDRKDQNAGS